MKPWGLEKINSEWPFLTAIEQQKHFLEINVGYAGSDEQQKHFLEINVGYAGSDMLHFLEQQQDDNSHSSVYTTFSYCY
jgi:hypothetical protein